MHLTKCVSIVRLDVSCHGSLLGVRWNWSGNSGRDGSVCAVSLQLITEQSLGCLPYTDRLGRVCSTVQGYSSCPSWQNEGKARPERRERASGEKRMRMSDCKGGWNWRRVIIRRRWQRTVFLADCRVCFSQGWINTHNQQKTLETARPIRI